MCRADLDELRGASMGIVNILGVLLLRCEIGRGRFAKVQQALSVQAALQ